MWSVVVGMALLLLVSPTVGLASPTVATDRVLLGRGGPHGYRLLVSESSRGWHWRELAILGTDTSGNGEPWIGYQCLTGDGRYAVAVVAPRSAANVPALRDRGASAYSVRVKDGRTIELSRSVALKYYNPGCGYRHDVVLTRNSGRDQAQTSLLRFDAATGHLLQRAGVRGQVTSAVPRGRSIIGVRGRALVRIVGSSVRRLVSVPGQPFALRARPSGVDLLTVTRRSTVVLTYRRGRVVRVGSGPAGEVHLMSGAAGRSFVVGSRRTDFAGTSGLRTIRSAKAPMAASLRGRAIVIADGRPSNARSTRSTAARADAPVLIVGGKRLVRPLGAATGRAKAVRPRGTRRSFHAQAAINVTTPKCAVPRNSLTRQVPQPNAHQVDWAIEQATRGNLKGSVLTRPANFLNTGLVSYQPSLDFAPVTLTGGGGAPIPPSVVQALYAQESNWKQASFHALPGVSGNPLVADYYGSAGGISSMDYDLADCGYGISQITDPMTAASPTFSANGKTKVALDYAENIAAGIQILAQKWNQLAAAGITVNGGNPAYLENWYFAIWAYNSGFHAQSGAAPWGLGWTNNPQNSDYPPDRTPFLRNTYADAAHPADWPYQERVIGFMESPLVDYHGLRSYSGPASGRPLLTLPSHSLFCASSNDCDPGYHNPSNPSLDYCQRTDRQCWWHLPVSFATCPGQCAQSLYAYSATATEPAGDDTYAPQCTSRLPAAAKIVDDQSPNTNIEGCGTSNWTSVGSFSLVSGTGAGGAPIGAIDLHQLGTGFGGHVYFTHNRSASDTAHLVTATWTPPSLTPGFYNIAVHIPVSGATSSHATYRIYRGDGTYVDKTISQHLNQNVWAPLGDYTLQPGAKVVLTNVNSDTPGTADIAIDAAAFTLIHTAVPGPAGLAAEFKPRLLFDSSEKWRPLNLTTFAAERAPDSSALHRGCINLASPDADDALGYHHSDTPDADDIVRTTTPPPPATPTQEIVAHCTPIDSLADVTRYRSEDAFLDLNGVDQSGDVSTYTSPDTRCHVGDLLDCNGDEITGDDKSAIYWHVSNTSGYTYVQYWIFYRFNSYADTLGIDQHEGDWEAVAVAPSPDASTFDFASFSQHGAWFSYLRPNLECPDVLGGSCGTEASKVGTRINVYVANGSQANYGHACSETIPEVTCTRGASGSQPERGYDGADPWGHNDDGAGLLPMPAQAADQWTDWAGRWGVTGIPLGSGSPRSPASQEAMFDQPWQSCSHADSGCPRPVRAARSLSLKRSVASAQRACASWMADDVVSVVCTPTRLRLDLSRRAMRGGMGARVQISRGRQSRAARNKGRVHTARTAALTQTIGRPLQAGDRVTVTDARRGGTEILLRVASSGGSLVRRVVLRSSSVQVRVAGDIQHPRLVVRRVRS